MNAGANALPAAQLGGCDFFGYFLGHKKVTTLRQGQIQADVFQS